MVLRPEPHRLCQCRLARPPPRDPEAAGPPGPARPARASGAVGAQADGDRADHAVAEDPATLGPRRLRRRDQAPLVTLSRFKVAFCGLLQLDGEYIATAPQIGRMNRSLFHET